MSSRLLLNTRVLTVAAPAYLQRCGRPKVPQDLAGHECLQYINPQDGRVFDWEFHRGKEVRVVETRGRLTLADGDALVRACVAGAGVAQILALGFESLIASGALVDLFPDWPDETFPMYAIRPSRRLPPAAVEAFLDFCTEICRHHA
jgi:DNA-binding transcriptional LysR family regulator